MGGRAILDLFSPLPLSIALLILSDIAWGQHVEALRQLWRKGWAHGIAIVCLLTLVNLLVDTTRDVRIWQRTGGPFVWPATIRFRLRFAGTARVDFLLHPFLIVAMMFLGGFFISADSESSQRIQPAWIAFAVLFLSDIAELLT